jgi:hypothetical protein
VSINIQNGRRTVLAKANFYQAGDMERAVVFEPGFNDRNGQYGVHGMDIRWILRGAQVATQFLMFTSWVPGECGREFRWSNPEAAGMFPMGADVGYHSKVQIYGSQDPMDGECDILGGQCYYDGSGLRADELLQRFIFEGEPAVWRELQDFHDELMEQILAGNTN